jgi:hypothetical protein
MIFLASLFGVGFSLAPPFEGHDEDSHFNYSSFLYHHQALPRPEEMPRGAAHHPPLYYALFSPLFALWGDADRVSIQSRINVMFPGVRGSIGGADNRNRLIHSSNQLGVWPDSPTARTLRLMRWASLLWVALTVYFLWKSLYEYVWQGQHWLAIASLAVILFNPKYLQYAGFINNDHLLWLGCAITLYLLLRMVNEGYSWRRSILLGLVLGLGLLNKFNSGLLAVPVGLTFLGLWRREGTWQTGWPHAAATLAIILTLASPWMLFNWVRYGDPTGYVGGVDAGWEGERVDGGFNLVTGLENAFPFAIKTFWNFLAIDSIQLPNPIWWFYCSLMLLGGLGMLWRLGRILACHNTLNWLPLLPLISLAITVLVILLFVASTYISDNHGRYLFPANLTWGALLIGGISTWIPWRWQPLVAKGLTSTMILLCGIALWGYFLPAFDPQLTRADSRPALACWSQRGIPVVELVQMQPTTIIAEESDLIRFELEWRALARPRGNLWEYVHIIGPNNQRIGARDSITGSGNHPSRNWEVGQQWRSTLWVEVQGQAQQVYPVEIGLYRANQTRLRTCRGNQPVNPAQVVIHGQVQSIPSELIARIGPEQIGLLEYTVSQEGKALAVAVEWVALQDGTANWVSFVQVRDSQNNILAQVDVQPKDGGYPTQFWQRGERIQDHLTLSLPAELPPDAALFIGFYPAGDEAALPIEANGETYYAGLPLQWP